MVAPGDTVEFAPGKTYGQRLRAEVVEVSDCGNVLDLLVDCEGYTVMAYGVSLLPRSSMNSESYSSEYQGWCPTNN